MQLGCPVKIWQILIFFRHFFFRIVFKTDSIGEEIKLLDTKVNVIKDHEADNEDRLLLIPGMY